MNCCVKSVLSRARPTSAFTKSKNTALLDVLISCSKSGEMIAWAKPSYLARPYCRTSGVHNHREHRAAQGSTGTCLVLFRVRDFPSVFLCDLCGYRSYFPITSFAIVANCMFEVPS